MSSSGGNLICWCFSTEHLKLNIKIYCFLVFEAESVCLDCPLLVTSEDLTFKFMSSVGQPSTELSSSPSWTFPYYLYQSPHPLLLLLQTLLPAVCNGIMLCSDVLPTELPDHSFPTPFVCSFSSLACACSPRHFLALLSSTFSSSENLQILSERSGNFSSAPCGLLPSLIFFF